MRVCGQAVCGCGSSGGLFAFIDGMCLFVYVYVCVTVCVCPCVCLCVCMSGGAGIGKCVWVWGLCCFGACIGGAGVAFPQKWYEIRTKFVQFRANFVRNLSPKCPYECGCYEFRTNFTQSSNNLHAFESFWCTTNIFSPSNTARQHNNNREEEHSKAMIWVACTHFHHKTKHHAERPMQRTLCVNTTHYCTFTGRTSKRVHQLF